MKRITHRKTTKHTLTRRVDGKQVYRKMNKHSLTRRTVKRSGGTNAGAQSVPVGNTATDGKPQDADRSVLPNDRTVAQDPSHPAA